MAMKHALSLEVKINRVLLNLHTLAQDDAQDDLQVCNCPNFYLGIAYSLFLC